MRRLLMTSCVIAALFAVVHAQTPAQGQQPPPTTRPSQTAPPARPAQTPPSGDVPAQPAPGVQQPQKPPTPGTAVAPQPAAQQTVWQNIKLDLVLTDNYTGTPVKKTVTMIMSSGRSGLIRTTNQVGGYDVELNVDAQAETRNNPGSGPIQIYTRITVQYMPAPTPETSSRGPSKPSGLHQSISFELVDVKPMLVSQSADPVTDRKVTLEVTATVLK